MTIKPIELPDDLNLENINNEQAKKAGTEVGIGAIKIEEKKTIEQGIEQEQRTLSKTESALPGKKRPSLLQRQAVIIPQARDEIAIKIEKIMEADLGDAYQRLSPIAKQEFRLKGEQTALKIRDLLKATHIKIKKILRLLLDWLRILPGVNRFFLEQEAKIKADKIIALKKL